VIVLRFEAEDEAGPLIASNPNSGGFCFRLNRMRNCRSSVVREASDPRTADRRGRPSPSWPGLIATIKSERGGRLLHLYRALLNKPSAGRRLAQTFHRDPTKGEAFRAFPELATLRVALLNGAEYEYARARALRPEGWREPGANRRASGLAVVEDLRRSLSAQSSLIRTR